MTRSLQKWENPAFGWRWFTQIVLIWIHSQAILLRLCIRKMLLQGEQYVHLKSQMISLVIDRLYKKAEGKKKK